MIHLGSYGWLLIPCAVLSLLAAYFAYRRSPVQPAMPWRAVLPGLRFFALLLCLLLLLQPLWRSTTTRDEAPILALLVDESLSVARHDSLLAATLSSLPAVDADVRLFGFGDGSRAVPEVDSLQKEAVRTNIAEALEHVQDDLAEEHVQAILLLSDGQYNTGRNPRYTAAESAVPVHAMAMGDTTAQRDVRLQRVATNELGYRGVELPLDVTVLSEGFEGQQVTLTVAERGQPLHTVRRALPPDGIVLPVSMQYMPTTPGLIQLTVSITHLEGETTHVNNSMTVTVNVLDRRQRLLVIAGAPHPDVAAMQDMLRADEEREVVMRVQKDRQSFYEGTIPDSLDAFDLVLMAGYPTRASMPSLAQQIAMSGVPLLFVLSEQTDLTLLRGTFGPVLPVAPVDSRPLFMEAALELTPGGRRHAALQGLPSVVTESLPPLQYLATEWQVSPDAVTLGVANVSGVNIQAPLLVTRSREGVRTAALLGAGSWRWMNLPEDLTHSDNWWPALFENLVQWLLAPEDDRLVRVSPAHDTFGGTEAVQFTGQVYDESLNGVDGATLSLNVTAPGGERYPHTMRGIGGGRYVADLGTLPEGSYSYAASASLGESALGTDNGTFAVGALVLEYAETRANVPLLRQIAIQSGGTYLPPGDLSVLNNVLRADSTFAPRAVESTNERALWQWPVLLGVVLVLLTAEWVLRKRVGMA